VFVLVTWGLAICPDVVRKYWPGSGCLGFKLEAAAPAGQVTSVGVVALFSALPLIGRAILLHFD